VSAQIDWVIMPETQTKITKLARARIHATASLERQGELRKFFDARVLKSPVCRKNGIFHPEK
jgi:hypothetical protein